MRYVVFDLDGTLVDSLPGIARGLNCALASLGRPLRSEQEICGMVGRGARMLCAEALGSTTPETPEDDVAALLQAFGREYQNTWEAGTVPCPGISGMLERFAALGKRLAVLSNKPHEVTVPLVAHVFPHIPFDFVFGYSDRFPRKPDPASLLFIASSWCVEPAEVAMVGDSIHDARTARAAGTQLGLVSWGYSGDADFSAEGFPVFETANALETWLMN